MKDVCFGYINEGISSIKINFNYNYYLYKQEIDNYLSSKINRNLRDICFDFMNADRISSEMMGMIVKHCNIAENLGIRTSAINIKKKVYNVMKVTGIDNYFHNIKQVNF